MKRMGEGGRKVEVEKVQKRLQWIRDLNELKRRIRS